MYVKKELFYLPFLWDKINLHKKQVCFNHRTVYLDTIKCCTVCQFLHGKPHTSDTLFRIKQFFFKYLQTPLQHLAVTK